METIVLQRFLDEGMLDIGEDDSRFEALAKTSEVLFEKLINDLAALGQYTLVALDPDIPPDEPVLQQVEELAKVQWKTIRTRSPDRIRQILRAVMLNTIANFTEQYPKHVATIWLMGSSYLPFIRSTSQAKPIEYDVLTKMGEFTEQWIVNATSGLNIDAVEFDLPELKLSSLDLPQVDREQLSLYLEAASGPQRQNNQAFPKDIKPNRRWPNDVPAWSYEFAPIAATGIASVIDKINQFLQEALAEYVSELHLEVSNYLEQVQVNLEQITNQLAQTSISSSPRTNLLWWKEALYSPRLKQSYRVLLPPVAMLALAVDLSQQVMPPYPISIDFFLKETAHGLLTQTKGERERDVYLLADLLKQLQTETNQQEITDLLNVEEIKSGRISLISYLRSLILLKNEAIENLLLRVGVSGAQEITLPDFAVWCFRTFQAEKLMASKVS